MKIYVSHFFLFANGTTLSINVPKKKNIILVSAIHYDKGIDYELATVKQTKRWKFLFTTIRVKQFQNKSILEQFFSAYTCEIKKKLLFCDNVA